MTEYEWEVGRVPRAPVAKSLGGSHPRRNPLAEYVALEFPRESITWVVSSEAGRESKGPTVSLSKVTKFLGRRSARK
jgi:hypothetical protein